MSNPNRISRLFQFLLRSLLLLVLCGALGTWWYTRSHYDVDTYGDAAQLRVRREFRRPVGGGEADWIRHGSAVLLSPAGRILARGEFSQGEPSGKWTFFEGNLPPLALSTRPEPPLEQLDAELRSDDWRVREAAARKLVRRGASAVPTLVAAAERDELPRWLALVSLADLGPQAAAAIPRLAPLAKSADFPLNYRTALTLLYVDPDHRLDWLAVVARAVTSRPDVERNELPHELTRHLPALLPAIRSAIDSDDPVVRRFAFEVVVRGWHSRDRPDDWPIRDQEFQAIIQAAKSHPDPEIAELANDFD